MQKLLDGIMRRGVFLVLGLLLGVASVGVGIQGGNAGAPEAGLCVSLGVLAAASLLGAVLLHVHQRR